jgi:hypothetical protein
MIPGQSDPHNLNPAAPSGVGWEALGPSIAWTIAAFLASGARCYNRVYLMHSVGAEDFLILLATVRWLV